MGELIRADFKEDPEATKLLEAAYKKPQTKVRSAFISQKQDVHAAFAPLTLVPARKLPLPSRNTLEGMLPEAAKPNMDNLFICPLHFGFINEKHQDRVDYRTYKDFNFHGFKTQLMFEPFCFGFVGDLELPKEKTTGQRQFQENEDLHRFLLQERLLNGGGNYRDSHHDDFVPEEAEASIRSVFVCPEDASIEYDVIGERLVLKPPSAIEPIKVGANKKKNVKPLGTDCSLLKTELFRRLQLLLNRVREMEKAGEAEGFFLADMPPRAKLAWCYSWATKRSSQEPTRDPSESSGEIESDPGLMPEAVYEPISSEEGEDEEKEKSRDADFVARVIPEGERRELRRSTRNSTRSSPASIASGKGSSPAMAEARPISSPRAKVQQPTASQESAALNSSEPMALLNGTSANDGLIDIPVPLQDPGLIDSQLQFNTNWVQERNAQTALEIFSATPMKNRCVPLSFLVAFLKLFLFLLFLVLIFWILTI